MPYSVPVKVCIHALQLSLHLVDVCQRPLPRINTPLDRSIFSGEAERIPASWVQHIVAFHSVVSCEYVRNGVDAKVTHV